MTEQEKLMQRIRENFQILLREKSGALPFMVLDGYKSDISLLCSPAYFTPEVLNLAMDLMWQIAQEKEKSDRIALHLLEMHTYERFRIRPAAAPAAAGHPYG